MTGYGVADGPVSGGSAQVEIRTVNHRHFNVNAKLPFGMQDLEGELRQRLRERIERGHVTVGIRWLEEPAREPVIDVNRDRAHGIVAALRKLQDTLELSGDIDLAFVARQPDVLSISMDAESPIDRPALWAIVDRAVDAVVRMREQEGAALGRDVDSLLSDLSRALERIEARAPERLTRERDRLRENVKALMAQPTVDESRLDQEIALLADKLDISEEIVRLQAHFQACRQALEAPEAVGRRLAFLGQELLREINTIGSKANDADIAHEVVGMKGRVEKYREQVENVE